MANLNPTAQHDADASANPVAVAKGLHSAIVAARTHIDREQAFPAELVDAMRAGNLFQLSLPAAIGGPQHHPLVSFEAVEALARADGSVGWCASISTSVSLFSGGWLDPVVARALFGATPNATMSGSVRAEGNATITPDGYVVSGQWDFASNINQARWMFCTCTLWENGEQQLTRAGAPRVRTMLIPIEQVTIVPTWSVVGMRGTGSHDFRVDNVHVPRAHTVSLGDPPAHDGLLYHPRLSMTCAWATTAAVALGIGRGAVDTFFELANRSGSTASRATLLRDRPRAQESAAQAEAILNSARAFLVDAVGTAWDTLSNDSAAPGAAIAQARLAITHAMQESVRAVDKLFHAAGTNAVYEKNGIERHFRDVHVAAQHAAGQMSHYETAGKALLGTPLKEPGW
ncbi:MAG: acyl-CoA dehydrogenase family protein [Gammaproteobacteria bacterium]|nr:acyl-CoA dehydrogenase family protein [Gammaproteobacteria bacterium]